MRKLIISASRASVVMGGGAPTARISLGRRVVAFTGTSHTVIGEYVHATANTVVRGGATNAVYTLTGDFTESEVMLHEFEFDAGDGYPYDLKIVNLLWPVTVGGVDYWVPPEWLLGSVHARPLPTHLLQDVGSDYWLDGIEQAICKLTGGGASGLQAYRASGHAGINWRFADSNFVGHSNVDAGYFVPTVSKRMLDNRSDVEFVPPSAPESPVIPDSTGAASQTDLRALERRLVSMQSVQNLILERLMKIGTMEDDAEKWSHNFTNLSTLDGNMRVAYESALSKTPTTQQRVAELVAVNLGVKLLVG